MENWYCLFTKPKRENYVSERLINVAGIEVFNPKIKRKKYVRGRGREVVEGLFPCYIFSRFNPFKHYHVIKYTRGVRRIVGDISGNPFLVDGNIVDQIRSRIKDGYILMEPSELNIGDQVVIQEGPLKGFTGIFQNELKARDRVMILLNTLAYQASIEVEKGYLARV